jgi:hypothetical protein
LVPSQAIGWQRASPIVRRSSKTTARRRRRTSAAAWRTLLEQQSYGVSGLVCARDAADAQKRVYRNQVVDTKPRAEGKPDRPPTAGVPNVAARRRHAHPLERIVEALVARLRTGGLLPRSA